MPRDPKDLSTTSPQRTARRLGEAEDQKEPIRLRVGAGPAGPQGPAGLNGTAWYQGTTVPSAGLGNNGDFYLRTTNSQVYQKSGGVWSELVNIKGSPGEQGEKGSIGETGLSGTGSTIACRLATAAALSANTLTGNVLEANAVGVQTIDGSSMAVNDQILVKNEVEGKKNGVYKVVTVGTAGVKYKLERIAAFNESPEAIPGMLITVAGGATLADTIWQLSTDAPITLNTTSLSFTRRGGMFAEQKQLNASKVLGIAEVDLPNCAITVPETGRYRVTGQCDFGMNVAGTGAMVGGIMVNGVIQSGLIVVNHGSAGERVCSSRTWIVSASAGNVIKLRGSKLVNAGEAVAFEVHTGIVVEQIV